ncbi:MAG: glycosyltransferase [Chloroflexota bacterium]|nr:glycosyltransferase [Chloroflexota bacterium]
MRIALATVGTTGDVRPFATLATRLVERGHEVTAISWPVHRTALSQSGVQVEVAGPHADPGRIASVAAEAAERGPMEQVAILRDFHLADGEAHYRRMRELLPGNDLVLLHGIHALAQAAAMDLGIPWATAVFDPVLLPTASAPPPGMPSLGPANRLLWGALDRMLQRTGKPLDDLLQRAGSSQRGLALFRARSPLLHLVACSPAIMRVPPDLPPTTHVSGAWLDRSDPPALPSELETFVADGAPPIIVTFGSMAGAPEGEVAAAIRAILDGGRRVIVQGAGTDASPSLLRVGSVDHRALFPRATLVVHHGGAGTTHAAVAAGVPSVVVPHVGDQRYWADRLHRLGVAPPAVPVRNLNGAALADASLTAASDPQMRAAAQALAARLADEDGVNTAVALLERAVA